MCGISTLPWSAMKTQIKYGKRLTAIGKIGKVEQCLELLRTMKNQRIALSHWNVSAVMNARLQSNHYGQAMNVWDELVSEYNVKPNFVCYTIAMRLAFNNNDHRTTLSLAQNVKKGFIKEMENWHWNRLIESYLAVSNVKSAMTEYNNMKLLNVEKSHYTYAILLHGLIKR